MITATLYYRQEDSGINLNRTVWSVNHQCISACPLGFICFLLYLSLLDWWCMVWLAYTIAEISQSIGTINQKIWFVGVWSLIPSLCYTSLTDLWQVSMVSAIHRFFYTLNEHGQYEYVRVHVQLEMTNMHYLHFCFIFLIWLDPWFDQCHIFSNISFSIKKLDQE